MRKNELVQNPNENERKAGINLYAYLPENMNIASEIIMAIATKIPNEIIQSSERIDEIITMSWEDMVRKMGKWLASLSMDQRTEAFVQYNITK